MVADLRINVKRLVEKNSASTKKVFFVIMEAYVLACRQPRHYQSDIHFDRIRLFCG